MVDEFVWERDLKKGTRVKEIEVFRVEAREWSTKEMKKTTRLLTIWDVR